VRWAPGRAVSGWCPHHVHASKGRRVRAGQGIYRGSLRCAQHGRSQSGGKRRTWTFPSLGSFGDLIRRCPAEPRLSGTGLCGSRHRRPWLHTCHPSRRITRNTDAENRFERHGNRAGVAARGRTPPVWCEQMNEVLLTALSGSQPLWIRGRRPFRRGNPLTDMARTISDLHILAILI